MMTNSQLAAIVDNSVTQIPRIWLVHQDGRRDECRIISVERDEDSITYQMADIRICHTGCVQSLQIKFVDMTCEATFYPPSGVTVAPRYKLSRKQICSHAATCSN